jgi:hypothetical protein
MFVIPWLTMSKVITTLLVWHPLPHISGNIVCLCIGTLFVFDRKHKCTTSIVVIQKCREITASFFFQKKATCPCPILPHYIVCLLSMQGGSTFASTMKGNKFLFHV